MKRLIVFGWMILWIFPGNIPAWGNPKPGTTEMVHIPAGPFLMGSTEKDGIIGVYVGVDEVPQHRVTLPSYYIDRYEVTTSQYDAFLKATGREPPEGINYPWKSQGAYPEWLADYPVVYVSWFDADAYCRWAGKRLPTEAEWEKAARGTEGRIFPWGKEFDPAKANVREYWTGIYEPEGEAASAKKKDPSGTRPVGSFPQDVSPYGVYDMAGNVSEWTASWYKPYPGSTLKRKAFGEVIRVLRGGAWVLEGYLYSRSAHRSRAVVPEKKHRSLGFRCAMDAR